jgi:hypothetical protein
MYLVSSKSTITSQADVEIPKASVKKCALGQVEFALEANDEGFR